MKQEISIRRKSSLVGSATVTPNNNQAFTFQSEALKLGYFFTEEALSFICSSGKDTQKEVFEYLNRATGAKNSWTPHYPGFPNQVLDLFDGDKEYSYFDWNFIYDRNIEGYEKIDFDTTNEPKKISLITESEFWNLPKDIMGIKSALSDFDKKAMEWFLEYSKDRTVIRLGKIPFKENLQWLFLKCSELKSDVDLSNILGLKDVLEIAKSLSGFVKTRKRKKLRFKLTNQNRRLIKSLLNVLTAKDLIDTSSLAKNQAELTRLVHHLHLPNSIWWVDELRNKKLRSDFSIIESAFFSKNLDLLLERMKEMPGIFARNLGRTFLSFSDKESADKILRAFAQALPKLSGRILIQLWEFSNNYKLYDAYRLVKPIGQDIFTIKGSGFSMHSESPYYFSSIKNLIEEEFEKRFKGLEVDFISKDVTCQVDDSLDLLKVPVDTREMNEGLRFLTRGSEIKIGDYLRFFDTWKRGSGGNDIIDLHIHSAKKGQKGLEYQDQVYYSRLRNRDGSIIHSGDKLNPGSDGRCYQFVDVDLEILEKNSDYVIMDMRLFGEYTQSFQNSESMVGFLNTTKEIAQKGKIFNPADLSESVYLNSDSRSLVVGVVDVKERKFIWLDIPLGSAIYYVWAVNENQKTGLLNIIDFYVQKEYMSAKFLLDIYLRANGIEHPKGEDGMYNVIDEISILDLQKLIV